MAMSNGRQAFLAACTMAAGFLSWNTASACSPYPPAKTTAYPSSGATDVSPMTTIKLVLGNQTTPNGLSLSTAKGAVPLPVPEAMGSGFHQSRTATFWRYQAGLQPATEYVLTDSSSGTPVELTRFTTAASYDKAQGPAATLESLRLWRVRYPLNQVRAGGCVFAEYEGYIELKFPPVALPGTPDDEVVQVVQLTPKTGGLSQSQVYSGNTTRLGTVLGQDGFPSPPGVLWKPELAPDREYCATIDLLWPQRRGPVAAPEHHDLRPRDLDRSLRWIECPAPHSHADAGRLRAEYAAEHANRRGQSQRHAKPILVGLLVHPIATSIRAVARAWDGPSETPLPTSGWAEDLGRSSQRVGALLAAPRIGVGRASPAPTKDHRH